MISGPFYNKAMTTTVALAAAETNQNLVVIPDHHREMTLLAPATMVPF
jgi:hypothetical protein